NTSRGPTRFDLRVALEGTVYTYTLHVDQSRIHLESLYHAPPTTRRDRRLFERRWVGGEQRFDWRNGPDFAGPHTCLQATLEDDEPFIRLLVQRLKVPGMEALKRWLASPFSGINLRFEGI